MSRFLRLIFLTLLAAALIWAAVVWHWQRTQRVIDMRDLVLYLLVLPLLVVGGALALRWAWRRAAAAQMPRPSAGPATSGAEASDAPQLQRTIRVLAQGVALPGAADAAAALQLAADSPPLQLDAAFRDRDGLGVFTRRHAGVPAGTCDRAQALLQLCMDPVLQQLQARAEAYRAAEPAAPPPAHPTLTAPRRPAPRKPVLHVLWGVAESAPAGDIDASGAAQVNAWAQQLPAFDWQLEIARVRSGEALLLQAERRLVLAQRDSHDDAVLLIAAQSWLDERRIEQLEAQGQLFSAQHHGGVMPGEAAAALLLATPAESRGAATVQLHRLAAQRRDKAADHPGRIRGDVLAEAINHAVKLAQQPVDQISLVVSDTDLRPSRTGELFDALQDAAAPLARAELCRCIGAVTGAVGIVSAPLALALAAAQVQQHREPVLLLTHADPFDRLAAVLSAPASQVPAVP